MKNFTTKDLIITRSRQNADLQEDFSCESFADDDKACTDRTNNTNGADYVENNNITRAMELKAAKAMELYNLQMAVANIQNRMWS